MVAPTALSKAEFRVLGFRFPESLPSGLFKNSFVNMLKLFEFSGEVDDVVDGNVLTPSMLDTSARTNNKSHDRQHEISINHRLELISVKLKANIASQNNMTKTITKHKPKQKLTVN